MNPNECGIFSNLITVKLRKQNGATTCELIEIISKTKIIMTTKDKVIAILFLNVMITVKKGVCKVSGNAVTKYTMNRITTDSWHFFFLFKFVFLFNFSFNCCSFLNCDKKQFSWSRTQANRLNYNGIKLKSAMSMSTCWNRFGKRDLLRVASTFLHERINRMDRLGKSSCELFSLLLSHTYVHTKLHYDCAKLHHEGQYISFFFPFRHKRWLSNRIVFAIVKNGHWMNRQKFSIFRNVT